MLPVALSRRRKSFGQRLVGCCWRLYYHLYHGSKKVRLLNMSVDKETATKWRALLARLTPVLRGGNVSPTDIQAQQ
jgi:hypothetical protein